MISKKNRLKERQVKKVLLKWKPFFSYNIILNYIKNNLSKNRYSIIIWKKSITTNISRVFFRRKFYELVNDNLINKKWIDYVFVVNKQMKLDKKNIQVLKMFKKDIKFLLHKI